MIEKSYIETVKKVKKEILRSRYLIAKVANKELLSLYFKVGNLISNKVAAEKWGSKTIDTFSSDLQNELKGLRGFSSTNLKRMRKFYDEWSPYFKSISITNEISPTLSDQFVELFSRVSFSNHYEIISNVKNIDARVFYISKSADEYWTNRNLKYQLKNRVFEKQKQLPNNFEKIVKPPKLDLTLKSFRDHYLLDFISLSDEEQDDEGVLETEIVQNIKKFLMSLGADFTFVGNQYRIIVAEKEFFIDLLFFNRKIQSLVAFELKTGEFKPEYLGKMNFYLSALDEYVKQPHEKPSIGIILCKEKQNKIVEFSFRDFDKAMGVATYTTSDKLPEKYKNILPDAESLRKLMD